MNKEFVATATLNREVFKKLRPEISEAIKEIGDKYGVTLKVGNASFSQIEGKFQLHVSMKDEDGLEPEERSFKLRAHLLGLDPNWLGKTFWSNGSMFKIIGLNLKARKNTVLLEQDGRTRVASPHQMVRRFMKRYEIERGE